MPPHVPIIELKEIENLIWVVFPGFLVCFLMQAIYYFARNNNTGAESSWLQPALFWSSWALIAIFFEAPCLLSVQMKRHWKNAQPFLLRIFEMGIRFAGIPFSIFGLGLMFNFPTQTLAGWTVFHYSLALFSSIIVDYTTQNRSC